MAKNISEPLPALDALPVTADDDATAENSSVSDEPMDLDASVGANAFAAMEIDADQPRANDIREGPPRLLLRDVLEYEADPVRNQFTTDALIATTRWVTRNQPPHCDCFAYLLPGLL